MLIVSDTSPLRYLVEVHADAALPRLYRRVMTTPAVLDELRQHHFPEVVRQWARKPPEWLEIAEPDSLQFNDVLDLGDASALSLARERSADIVLIDERLATNLARSIGLISIGTLAVLQEAGFEKLVDFHSAIQILTTQTTFRHSQHLITQVIADYDQQLRNRPAK